jgi:hypothetical protein
LTLINEAVIGDIVRIEKNDEWNQWIQFKFPDLEARLLVLEGKVGTATSIASRLLATEVNLASAEADIVTLNGLVSGNSGDITNAKVDITNLQNAVVGLASRTSDLEAFMGIEGYATIDNGVVVAKEISELEVDGYAYTSVKIDYEIARQTGTEYRSTVGTMYLVCKSNGVWYTERGLQIIDMDGVTFTIATNAGKIGKVSYVSDTVSGGGYTGYFKFRLTKFEV